MNVKVEVPRVGSPAERREGGRVEAAATEAPAVQSVIVFAALVLVGEDLVCWIEGKGSGIGFQFVI